MKAPDHLFLEFSTDEKRLSEIESGFDTEEWADVSSDIFRAHLLQAVKYKTTFEYIGPIAALLRRLVDEKGAVDVLDIGGGCGQILADILIETPFEKWGSVAYRIVDSERSRTMFEDLKDRKDVLIYDKADRRTVKIPNPLYNTKSSFVRDFSFEAANTCDILLCNTTSNYIFSQSEFYENVAKVDFGYFVLSRTLFAGTGPFGGIEQVPHVPGARCGIWFLNRDRIIGEFLAKGFSLFHQSESEPLPPESYPPDWPPEHRTVTEDHLIFAGKRA